jgi:hypothetical protein
LNCGFEYDECLVVTQRFASFCGLVRPECGLRSTGAASDQSFDELRIRRMPPGGNAMPTADQARIDIYDIANRLWETADELHANSHLKAAEYSIPVLGLIFLESADSRFTKAHTELAGRGTSRREIGQANYQAKGVLYLPEQDSTGCLRSNAACRRLRLERDIGGRNR